VGDFYIPQETGLFDYDTSNVLPILVQDLTAYQKYKRLKSPNFSACFSPTKIGYNTPAVLE
jgi:hypothetical protein